MNIRLIGQACGCSTVRGGDGLKESRCVRVSDAGTPNRHLQVFCLCNGATMQLRLIGQGCGCSMVRGGGGLMTVSARLCRRHSTQALAGADGTSSRHHLQVFCLCNGAATLIRMIEQACGCSTV